MMQKWILMGVLGVGLAAAGAATAQDEPFRELPPASPSADPPGAGAGAADATAPADAQPPALTAAERQAIVNDPIQGQDLAVAYGVEQWPLFERLQFTFNVDRGPDQPGVARSWDWDIVGDTATRTVDGQSVTVEAVSAMDAPRDEAATQAHRQFINDSYWLLFPFQLAWSNPTVTEAGGAPLPIGEEPTPALKLICTWPDEGGYTPGDAYDLYLGNDGLIAQWVFRKGGAETGSPATWENHAKLGPIIVSLDHRNREGLKFLYFTEVSATLAGTAGRVTPLPIVEP